MKSGFGMTVFHVEDKAGWRETIQDIVETLLPELKYVGLEGPIDNALDTIRASGSPAIALFDLRLTYVCSEYESSLKLLGNLRELQRQGVELFILSGRLSDDLLRILINQGIGRERIFHKGDVESSELARALSIARLKLLSEDWRHVQGPFKMVHLSDIHMGQERSHRWFHHDIRRELLNDLSTMAKKRGIASAIFITGDTAFSGKRTEYEEAKDWIRLACENAGCCADAVFLVPGNHDVNWSRITGGVELFHRSVRTSSSNNELLRNLAAFEQDGMAANSLLAKLQDYRDFARGYGRDFQSFEEAHWTHDVTEFRNPTIRIVGLNTVLFSDKDDSMGKIILPQSQYVLPRRSDVEYIVLMHHPLEWLRNSRSVRQYLDNRARICMMGHEHELRVNHSRNLAGFERLEIYAGATNPPSSEQRYEYRYNWLELSIETAGDTRQLMVSLWPRIWTSATQFSADRNALMGDENRLYSLPLASSV